MIRIFVTFCLTISSLFLAAQSSDPVLMRINGKDIMRSEFEYAFNKNNTALGEKATAVQEYLPMFVDFKLKVAEAEEMRLDTLASFKEELATNRAQLAENYLVDENYIERKAHDIYAKDSATIGAGGFLKVIHLIFPLRQTATPTEVAAAKAKADSAYNMLNEGKAFDETGRYFKVMPNAYTPFEIMRGQAYKEFEDVAYSLADGQYSSPFKSPVGYHIVKRISQRPFGQYEEYRANIIKMLEQRNIRHEARMKRGYDLAREMGGGITPQEALAREDSLLEEKYPEFSNLMREYYDGLLFFEVCNREVWNKASNDIKGLEKYFKKNKKKYKFETPRFRGAVIHAKNETDLAKAKNLVAEISSAEEYRKIIDDNFYIDSVYTVRLEIGVFAVGDNGWVDKIVFSQGDGGKKKRGYEYVDVAGKVIEKPETYNDVRGLVVSDYQKHLENEWVKTLRKKFDVRINDEVLKTVNNHD